MYIFVNDLSLLDFQTLYPIEKWTFEDLIRCERWPLCRALSRSFRAIPYGKLWSRIKGWSCFQQISLNLTWIELLTCESCQRLRLANDSNKSAPHKSFIWICCPLKLFTFDGAQMGAFFHSNPLVSRSIEFKWF